MKKFLVIYMFLRSSLLFAMDTPMAIRTVRIENLVAASRLVVSFNGTDARPYPIRVGINNGNSASLTLVDDAVQLALIGGPPFFLRRRINLDHGVTVICAQADGIHFEDESGMVSIIDLQ